MSAARKQTKDQAAAPAEKQAQDPAIPQHIAGAVADMRPVSSPARELQANLARSLRRSEPSKLEVAMGIVAGIMGATWVTGLLIYATL